MEASAALFTQHLTFKVKLRVMVENERCSVLLIYKAVTYTTAVLNDRAFTAHGL